MTWEKYVYKFVIFSLCVGLLATVIRWILALVNETGDIVEYVGGPIAILVDAILAFVLWRGPHLLRFVLKSIYWFMPVGEMDLKADLRTEKRAAAGLPVLNIEQASSK
ncbi:hypothetical protein [Paenibacillus abyssi]|uniref:Uncharacterized protein n=2 Tax=Paenibacillus abyssi TaxID=1340531 RepID=A0A917FV53_9BACL|nr:hypothetical protein [Paenibacillus abyssi]GGG05611.1 hypothetical protein GCM10010916_23290 [Paenibacillus abyssi]